MNSMIGFEQYTPSKWLEGIFAVHLKVPVSLAEKAVRRSGKWSVRGVVAAAVAVTGAFASDQLLASPTQTVSMVQLVPSVALSLIGDVAPPGYFAALSQSVTKARLLPEQSIAADPEFSF